MSGIRTKKILVPRSENARAQRIYLIVVGLLIWANFITVLALIFRIFAGRKVDPLGSLVIITVFVSMVVGLYGILKIKPPLHYLISVGAVINVVISFSSVYGYLQGLASILLLYIAIRFPIKFEYQKRALDPTPKIKSVRVTPRS